jgi:hypothetical protein
MPKVWGLPPDTVKVSPEAIIVAALAGVVPVLLRKYIVPETVSVLAPIVAVVELVTELVGEVRVGTAAAPVIFHDSPAQLLKPGLTVPAIVVEPPEAHGFDHTTPGK